MCWFVMCHYFFLNLLHRTGGRVDVRHVDVLFYEQDPLPKDLLRELIWRYSEEGDLVTSMAQKTTLANVPSICVDT